MNHLYFRTEAGPQIGIGHFMRCFALAEAARQDGTAVTFLMNAAEPSLIERLRANGIGLVTPSTEIGGMDDAEALRERMADGRKDWLVVDSYRASASYLSQLQPHACILFIDDQALLDPLPADIVVNAAPSAVSLPYDRIAPGSIKLLGPDYALIRHEFRQTYARTSDRPAVAVMFGGSDPLNLTAEWTAGLCEALAGVEIRAIVGPAHRHPDSLRHLEGRYPGLKVHIAPPSVARVLAGCDLVVTAAGGSIDEVAAMGLAALALVIVDNQAEALQSCPYPVIDARYGLPSNLPDEVRALLGDDARRNTIAARAHALIDGQGPQRILSAMRAYPCMSSE